MMGVLPDKPSELIHIGLKDMASAEESPLYDVYMGVWHHPGVASSFKVSGLQRGLTVTQRNGVCAVCYAGGVMAFTLGADINLQLSPKDFGDDELKLVSLDSFRRGDVEGGFYQMGLGGAPIDNMDVAMYGYHPDDFKRDMRLMADNLAAVGY